MPMLSKLESRFAKLAGSNPLTNRMLKLDFLIPASPTDAFFSQIALFRLALDALGEIYRKARVVAVLGCEAITAIPSRWDPYLERVEVVWADPGDFKRRGYRAQGDLRFERFRPDADLVVLCDADTVFMRPWLGLAETLAREPRLAGGIAHYHFPWTDLTAGAVEDWKGLARSLLGHDIPLDYRYSLQDPDRADPCPFYINYGFFAGTPALFAKFFPVYRDVLPEVKRALQNHFDGQVALALAIAQLELPAVALPLRYNFPNDPQAYALYPEEREQMVMLHYLRTLHFDRHIIFAGEEPFRKFLSLDLEGSNRDFQAFVRELTRGRYPFGSR